MMTTPLLVLASSAFLWLLLAQPQAARASAPLSPRRIVFLGDSITDGHTYPALVAQALEEAGRLAPIVTNAGIGGDTARGMTTRLERDVFRYKPDLMTLSVGINDVLRKVEPDAYAADVEKILAAAAANKTPVLVLTTSTLGTAQAEADGRLEKFNAVLREAASRHGLLVGDVNTLMKQARARGETFMEVDDIHPNFEGQRLIARAVLDAMGYADVPVPARLALKPMPGLVSPWKMRPIDKLEKPLTEESALAAVKDAADSPAWKLISLPEPTPIENVWLEQERKRGFAVAIERTLGKSPLYLGVASVRSDREKTLCFNTGGQLKSLWVNGRNVYRHTDWHGWHAGRERLIIPVHAGDNALVIETSNQFFLSVTNDDQW